MRVLIAPDSFKLSLSADRVAAAMAQAVAQVFPDADADLCPIADGGEGTADAIVNALHGRFLTLRVTGPLGHPVDARLGWVERDRLAVIEIAQSAGLALVPLHQRDPTATTTRGVGEMILAALDLDPPPRRLLLAIGGSATCDAGAGMAEALGVRFLGAAPPLTGGQLRLLRAIDTSSLDPRLRRIAVDVACDVTNPLFGPDGAAHVYAPQKGATPAQVASLDAGLRHIASLVPRVDADAPGMGAAGGLGFGLVAFCGGRLRRGVELVLDAVRFNQRLDHADLVLTGEGRLDAQTAAGKACAGVASAASAKRRPVIAVVGSLGPGHETITPSFRDVRAICGDPADPVAESDAMAEPERWIRRRTEQALRAYVQVQ